MLHCYFNNGRYIVIKNYLTLFHFCYEINEFSCSVLYCISLHELISLQELICYIEHECVVLMRVCLEYLRRSLFSRGGIRLEQTVIFLRNVMIFLKVPVGMRKIATLTMEKTVRDGTSTITTDISSLHMVSELANGENLWKLSMTKLRNLPPTHTHTDLPPSDQSL